MDKYCGTSSYSVEIQKMVVGSDRVPARESVVKRSRTMATTRLVVALALACAIDASVETERVDALWD